MNRSRIGIAALLLPALLAGAVPVRAQAAIDDTSLTTLLMSADEKAAFARLPQGDRERYVADLWASIDPSPGTAENELRSVLRRRAERAAAMFADEPRPGWDTDRGHVLAILGLPDEIERRTIEIGAPPPKIVWTYRRGSQPLLVTFVRTDVGYELEGEVTLNAAAFYTSAQLELRLLVAAGVGAVEGIAPTRPAPVRPPAPTSAAAASGSPGSETPTATGPAPDTVAPEVAVWMQMIFGGVMRDDLELQARLDTMPAREGTYTVLSFRVGHESLVFETAAEVAARLNPPRTPTGTAAAGEETAAAAAGEAPPTESAATRPGETQVAPGVASNDPTKSTPAQLLPVARLRLFGAYLQGEPGAEDTVHAFIIPFEAPRHEPPLGEEPSLEANVRAAGDEMPADPDASTAMRSAAVTLVPGTYRLAWGILDEATGNATTRDQQVVIPDYTVPGLNLTRPLLVRPPHQQALRELTADEVVRGVRMGNLVLDADLDDTFARDEIVEVVTVATGWGSDPGQPGKPSLEVEYRIVPGGEGGRALARLPAQSLDFSILGQQIPLGQVRAIEAGGTYRIEVRVKDLITGQEAVASTPIRIAPAPPDGSTPDTGH